MSKRLAPQFPEGNGSWHTGGAASPLQGGVSLAEEKGICTPGTHSATANGLGKGTFCDKEVPQTKVTAVIARNKAGEYIRFKARKAVVLAGGSASFDVLRTCGGKMPQSACFSCFAMGKPKNSQTGIPSNGEDSGSVRIRLCSSWTRSIADMSGGNRSACCLQNVSLQSRLPEALLVMVAPETASAAPVCAMVSSIVFAACPPMDGVSCSAVMVQAAIAPFSTEMVTVTGPPKPVAVPVNSCALAVVSSISANSARASHFFMIVFLPFPNLLS